MCLSRDYYRKGPRLCVCKQGFLDDGVFDLYKTVDKEKLRTAKYS